MIARTNVGLMILASLAARARACPLCDSEQGVEVRAGIFNDDFIANLAISSLPFLLLAVIVAAAHFAFPEPKARPSGNPSE